MTRTLLLTVHLAGMAMWLGANATQFAVAPRLLRRGGPVAAAWAEAAASLVQRYYNLAGALLGVSGVLLVQHGHWSWSSGFIWVGIATLVVGATLGVVEFLPGARRLQAAADAGDEATLRRTTRRFIGAAVVDTSLVLLTVLAMVHKWHAG